MTTYEKIYKALKDKNACKFNVSNQVFFIEREQLIKGVRYNLYRCFLATDKKQWLKSFGVRGNAFPFNYQKCIREFLEGVFSSCMWCNNELLKYTSRKVRKINHLYFWRNQWDHDFKVRETYDLNGNFCGWVKYY